MVPMADGCCGPSSHPFQRLSCVGVPCPHLSAFGWAPSRTARGWYGRCENVRERGGEDLIVPDDLCTFFPTRWLAKAHSARWTGS
jgi:hypothetical protein